MSEVEGHQQHPLGIYFKVWILLFVLSFLSYMVDYIGFQGEVRWILILVFMWLKAGMIVAVFMHMRWERMTLITAIMIPPLCLIVFVAFMNVEGGYTFFTRLAAFTQETFVAQPH